MDSRIPAEGTVARQSGKQRGDIWIIGGGRFGLLAAERLSRRWRGGLRVVEPDAERRAVAVRRLGPAVPVIDAEGAAFLSRRLTGGGAPEWIVPAVPVHLACEWLRRHPPPGTLLTTEPVPAAVRRQLPNPFALDGGAVAASLADFLCPDDCCEPAKYCTVTGRRRSLPLFARLARIAVEDFRPVVIRSHQLEPGVGGYRPQDLTAARRKVARAAGGRVLLATACRCHGIIHALQIAMPSAP